VFKVIKLQVAMILLAAAIVSIWLRLHGSISVVLGGAAYVLPNLVFILRLRVATAAKQASAVTFFVGELFKVLATVVLLAGAHFWFGAHWLAMLIGLFVALKANLFAFLLKT
jgi:ATP synthase protein I